MKYYGPSTPSLFVVLSIGLPPFCTDNEREALREAMFRKDFSRHVTVFDIDDNIVIEYRNGYQVLHSSKKK